MARHVAVLFDADGTLLDSQRSIRDSLNAVLRGQGLAPFSAADMGRLIGRPLRDILRERGASDAEMEAMVRRYRDAYNEAGWVTATLYLGLEELLPRLKRRGLLLAVVTSKGQREMETLLLDLGMTDLFDAVVGDDDLRPLKPHPAPVLEACRRLGVEPEQAAMVGDTRYDVEAAKAAGCHAVGVLWGIGDRASLEAAGTDALAADAGALERHLTRWARA